MTYDPRFGPDLTLGAGEEVIATLTADTTTFWRTQALMTVFFAALAVFALWAIGNAYIWTGAVGAVLAMGVRALYIGSDERKIVWVLTNQRLLGPAGRATLLPNITKIGQIYTALQIVTLNGDKHMIRYLRDPETTKDLIETHAQRAHS